MATDTPVTLTNPRNPNDVLTTSFTNLEAAYLCVRAPQHVRMARDIGNRVIEERQISTAQHFWLHRLALEQQERERPPEVVAPRVWCDCSDVCAFLNPASESLKSGACITFRCAMPDMGMSNDGTVQIKRARATSRYPGQYFVTDGTPYPRALIYGRILTDGSFVPHTADAPEPPVGLLALLDELKGDIRQFVQLYGIKTGRCCFCDLPLEDQYSTKLGYGPVCAKHYRMPHGKKAVEALERGKPLSEQKVAPAGGLFASDLGWAPGHWPEGFAHKGLWWVKGDARGLNYIEYRTPDGKQKLNVFND